MQVLSQWITVIAVVAVVAWLVYPGNQSREVIGALGSASADNIKALSPGSYRG